MRRLWLLLLIATVAIVAVVLWPRSDHEPAKPVAAKTAKKRVDKTPRPDPRTLPLAAIEGVVRDDAGKPLAADVCANFGEEQRCAKAGADGRYAVDGIVVDAVTVTASFVRYEPAVAHPKLAPGERRTLDLTMKPGGLEMTGVVEDMLGGPIAKAQVRVHGMRTETDDRGRFSIWVWSPKRPDTFSRWGWLVHASASGYGPRTESVQMTTNVVIALAPESAIAGRVVDERGTAVPNARVIGSTNSGAIARATSDAAGAFVLDHLSMGDVTIEALTPSSYGRHAAVVSLGVGERVEDVVVQVSAAHSVIAKVEVEGDRAICDPAPVLRDWSFHVPEPWRDAEGRYHFEGVPPGTYSVELGCNVRVPPVVVADEDVEVTWRVAAGGVVKGRVRTDRAVNAKVSRVELSAVGSRRPAETREADNGAFEFRGVAPGKYSIRAIADRHTFDRETLGTSEPIAFDLANGQTVEHELVVVVSQHGKVSGRVVDDRGRAVAQATIDFTRDEGPRAANYIAEVKDGRYELDLPAGKYRAWASGREYSPANDGVEVRDGVSSTLDLTLARDKRSEEREQQFDLVGRVVDENDAPVGGAIVTAQQFRRPRVEPDLRTTTRADGSFTLRSKMKRMEVQVYRVGGGSAEDTITAGEPATIQLARDLTIAGVVTRSDGTPAPRFHLRDTVRERTYELHHTGGRFTVKVDFPVTLAAGINGVYGDPVTLEEPTQSVALKLPPTVTIRGRIVDGTTHAPVMGVRVAGRQGVDGWAPWFIHPDQVTDADGRFAMREVPRGPLMIEINPPTETWSTQSMKIDAATQTDLGEISLSQARRR